MLGLVSYESSDEDEINTTEPEITHKTASEDKDHSRAKHDANVEDNAEPQVTAMPDVAPGPVNGPMLGPSQPQEALVSTEAQPKTDDSSLYTTSEALIQDLTLPPIPNLEIPPSPPGSPDPTATSKVSHFLSLKKQGVHFNEKLSASSSLKNPMLFTKLRDHNDINDHNQYATVLPHDIWNPDSLPDWAYKEELWKMQQAVRQKIEQSSKNRQSIDFVSSGARRG
ncbi:uncharacterized protein TRUGW13939_09783 [Talaromyces rugulosus]|uniref:HCNGP-like protein n=1 Tax=Talaromyces rugulosus TaxID=121627 RepID=A0A7H8R8B5_TALRU|nr:uncharacterized protein TRUGW13939_09783 [Talaromyces rugulosus]QKX62622.1 hypothetical protein TRUGW13939_09783 [Talaromyces rugulosus]